MSETRFFNHKLRLSTRWRPNNDFLNILKKSRLETFDYSASTYTILIQKFKICRRHPRRQDFFEKYFFLRSRFCGDGLSFKPLYSSVRFLLFEIFKNFARTGVRRNAKAEIKSDPGTPDCEEKIIRRKNAKKSKFSPERVPKHSWYWFKAIFEF